MAERKQEGVDRRTVLKRIGYATLGTLVGVDQGPRLAELPLTHSEIVFSQSQQERLTKSNSVCLIFGGATVQSVEPLAKALTPALEPLGAVGGINYAKHDLDVSSIVKDMRKLQREHGITEFSFYLHSLGAPVLGEVMEELGDEVTLGHIFLDCVPPTLDHTDMPRFARALGALPYDGGAIVTGLANTSSYGTPIKEGTALPGLYWDQFEALRAGERYLRSLARAARRSGSKVYLLTPEDPEKDVVVDAVAAEERLRQSDLFPDMWTYYVRGNQAHGNSPVNQAGYHQAIRQALEDSHVI